MASPLSNSNLSLSVAHQAQEKKSVPPEQIAERMAHLQTDLERRKKTTEQQQWIGKYVVKGGYDLTAFTTAAATTGVFKGGAGLHSGPLILGALVWGGGQLIDAALESHKESAKKAAAAKINETIKEVTKEELAQYQTDRANGNKQAIVNSLLSKQPAKDYLEGFKEPEEKAYAAACLLQHYEDRHEALEQGKEDAFSHSQGNSDGLTNMAKEMTQLGKNLKNESLHQKKVVADVQRGVKVLTNQVTELRKDVAAGNTTAKDSLEKLEFLEQLAKNRMTPEEKVQLVSSGHLKLTEEEKEDVRKAVSHQHSMESANRTVENAALFLNVMGKFGGNVNPDLQKAVGLAGTTLSALAQAPINPVGAFLTMASGIADVLGDPKPDPAAERQKQIMEAFGEVMKGQQLLMEGQSKIFEQGQETLKGVCQLQAGQAEMLKLIDESMKRQVAIYEALSTQIEKVHKDVLEGNRKILEQTVEIIRAQVTILETVFAIQEEVHELHTQLETTRNDIVQRINIVYYEVHRVGNLVAQLHDKPLVEWIAAAESLTNSISFTNEWNSQTNGFVSYEAMCRWVGPRLELLRSGWNSYVTMLPSSATIELDPRLLWQTRETDYVLQDERVDPSFRIGTFLPLVNFFNFLPREGQMQFLASLLAPVQSTRNLDDKKAALSARSENELLQHFSSLRFISRAGYLSQLVHPKYLLQFSQYFSLLTQLRSIDVGHVLTAEEIGNANTPITDEPRKILERFFNLFDLTIAQQSLISGEYTIPYLWDHFFHNVVGQGVSIEQQRLFMRILYNKDLSLDGTTAPRLTNYDANYLTTSREKREDLFKSLWHDTTNPLLTSNLMCYVVKKYLALRGVSLAAYQIALTAAPIPYLLQQQFPGWKFVYSDEKKQWMGIVQFHDSQHYLSLPMPSFLSVQQDVMHHPEILQQLAMAQTEIGLTIGELDLGKDRDSREAILALLELT